jgi:hypothetical protein
MAYTLQALIADRETLSGAGLDVEPTAFVPLPQAMAMLPLTSALLEQFGIPFLPLTEEGADTVPEELDDLGTFASARGPVAYVEAEIFGESVTQAGVLWHDGAIVLGPVVAEDAINRALKALGVTRSKTDDEFHVMELGRHTATDDWVPDV